MNLNLKDHRETHSGSDSTFDFNYRREFSSYFSFGSNISAPRVTCTFLIGLLFVTNLFLNASYGICAPFLPMMAEMHSINQRYLGIMFWVYSISMAIASPIIGKFQLAIGRRNVVSLGMVIVGVPFLGFAFINYAHSSHVFIGGFILFRIIQGMGASLSQTATYAILTLTYPNNVNFVVGWIETSAGIGLSLGPVIGSLLYEIGGIDTPFLTFFHNLIIYRYTFKIFSTSYCRYLWRGRYWRIRR